MLTKDMQDLNPAPCVFQDAPRYFKRIWDTTGTPLQEERNGVVFITPQFGRLVIYGYSTASPYPEDQAIEARLYRERQVFPAVNYSRVCPGGEYGHVSLSDVEEVTEEEFNAARDRGWTE